MPSCFSPRVFVQAVPTAQSLLPGPFLHASVALPLFPFHPLCTHQAVGRLCCSVARPLGLPGARGSCWRGKHRLREPSRSRHRLPSTVVQGVRHKQLPSANMPAPPGAGPQSPRKTLTMRGHEAVSSWATAGGQPACWWEHVSTAATARHRLGNVETRGGTTTPQMSPKADGGPRPRPSAPTARA